MQILHMCSQVHVGKYATLHNHKLTSAQRQRQLLPISIFTYSSDIHYTVECKLSYVPAVLSVAYLLQEIEAAAALVHALGLPLRMLLGNPAQQCNGNH
eukprot:jgi/Chrzof1/1644/Cz10g15160.t1